MRKYRKLVCGVGINDADYKTSSRKEGKRDWLCPYYSVWKRMIDRCYNKEHQKTHPTYRDCSVCHEWLTFSNFKSWMEKQDWKDKHLDKDLLKVGNRVYSADTCVFVDIKINSFVLENGARRGKYMLGVYWQKDRGKFQASCRNPFTNKKVFLGRYDMELEAHLAWKRKKHEFACQLADSEYCNDPRLAEALRTRYL